MNLAQFLKENPDISSRTNHKDNDDLCIICHEKTNKKDRAYIPCNHNMHWKCLLESINVSFISGLKNLVHIVDKVVVLIEEVVQ